MLFLTSNESDVVFRSAVVAAFSNRKKARVKIHHSAGYRWVSEFESLGPDSAFIFLFWLKKKQTVVSKRQPHSIFMLQASNTVFLHSAPLGSKTSWLFLTSSKNSTAILQLHVSCMVFASSKEGYFNQSLQILFMICLLSLLSHCHRHRRLICIDLETGDRAVEDRHTYVWSLVYIIPHQLSPVGCLDGSHPKYLRRIHSTLWKMLVQTVRFAQWGHDMGSMWLQCRPLTELV